MKNFENHIIPKIEAGRSNEAVRNIIKTGQYAEQDRRESLKETYKPITDELGKVDEGIYKLKDELKDLKAVEGPPALPAIEGPQAAAITHDDYIAKEEQESVLKCVYPDISELVDNYDLRKQTLEKLATDNKSLGGQKRSAYGKKRDELDFKIKANKRYRKLINSLPPDPQEGSGVFYYNNPRDLFDRLHLLGGSIMAGNNSAKNEFSEFAHTLHKLGAFPSEDLNSLLSKFLAIK